MSWYQTQLLQASPQLMTMGTTLQNQAGSQMLNSLTGGLNDISKYKQFEEDRAYQDLLNQHIASMQHLNAGTENERINPLATANGNSIYNYLSNASNYVKGMAPDRAGSLFNKFLQQRTAQANVEQNLLNSKIKQNAQQQATTMQNYINQVGDANKDGLIDVKDLNPTEQTAVNSLYGSVANKLLGTAQQHGDLLSKLSIQDKYWNKHNDKQFAQKEKILNEQITEKERLSKINSINNVLNKTNTQLMQLESLDKSQMTPDMVAKYNFLKQEQNVLSKQLLDLQNISLPKQNTITAQGQNSNIQYPSIFNASNNAKKTGIINKLTTKDLNMPNATQAQTQKTLNSILPKIDLYNNYKERAKQDPYYAYLANDMAVDANKVLKPNKQLHIEPDIYSKIKNIGLKEGIVGNNFEYSKNISMAMDALKEAERIGDTKAIKNLSTIIQKLKTEQAQQDTLHSGNNAVPFLEKLKNSAKQSIPIVNILQGTSKVPQGDKPETTKQAVANTVKYLYDKVPQFSKYITGETGDTHFAWSLDDDVAYDVGSKYLIPALKNYIATTKNTDASSITNKEVEKFISDNMLDKNANTVDVIGGILHKVGLGDTRNFTIKKPLREALEAIKLQFK